MTNKTISTQIDQFVTEANKFVISSIPTSVAKGLYIEFPIFTLYATSPFDPIVKTVIASTTYEIRTQIKNVFSYFMADKYITDVTKNIIDGTIVSGATAGLIGGAFKYYMTAQNPLVGALNNAAYEVCNNIELCSNNKNVNIAFIIAVESLDAAAQTMLNVVQGNAPGAIISALKGGATVGVLVASTVYDLYVPALELQDPEYNVAYHIMEKLGVSELDTIDTEL